MRLSDYLFVGIDLHKLTHTAMILDSCGKELGTITFENVSSDFSKLERKVKKCIQKIKLSQGVEVEAFYCLENAYGYGRALAVWLIDKEYVVKDVNPALSNRQAKHRAMYRKVIGILEQYLLNDKDRPILNTLYSRYKGYVDFSVKCVNTNDICRLIISVEDSGRGIKTDDINKLFTKFHRLDEDRNTTIEGTGLGLAITKQLIDLMGGKKGEWFDAYLLTA